MSGSEQIEEAKIDPKHACTRKVLRRVGPVLLVLGLICMVVGGIRMFSPAWQGMDADFDQSAWTSFTGFGLAAAGMFLLFVGIVMTVYGFAGAAARYATGEFAPVVKDGVNYLAEGTQDGVRAVGRAVTAGVAEGLRQGRSSPSGAAGGTQEETACPSCGQRAPADSRFCPRCGTPLGASVSCAACGGLNEADARFCRHCGRAMG